MNSIDIISQSVKKGELTHAYLAPVRSGTNLDSYASELGQLILCSPEDEDCRSRVIRDTHPDFIPVKVLNDNSKISINQVEEIISSSSYSPVEAEKKLYVISRAEDLSREGANSLLKILEDPPDFVYFLLLTESPNGLLPTIISRCQQLPKGGTTVDGMKKILDSKGLGEEEVNYLIEVVNKKATLLDELLAQEFENPLEKRRGFLEEYENLDPVELSDRLSNSSNFIERDVLSRLIFEKLEKASNLKLLLSVERLTKLTGENLEWFLDKGREHTRKYHRKQDQCISQFI